MSCRLVAACSDKLAIVCSVAVDIHIPVCRVDIRVNFIALAYSLGCKHYTKSVYTGGCGCIGTYPVTYILAAVPYQIVGSTHSCLAFKSAHITIYCCCRIHTPYILEGFAHGIIIASAFAYRDCLPNDAILIYLH